MSLEVFHNQVDGCPVCGQPVNSSLDFVRCSGKCENVLHFSCPLNTEDTDFLSVSPNNKKAWKCKDCTESILISSVDSTDQEVEDVPSGLIEEPSLPALKICGMCNELVKNPFNSLTCFTCKSVVHYMCVGYSSEKEFDDVLEDTKLSWKCETCFTEDLLCEVCQYSAAENPFDVLRCCECQQVYHYACVGFTLEIFDELSEKDKIEWLCRKCSS